MKKGAVLILAILYITLTSGVMVNIHYCMGRIADVTYGHDAEEKCGKCGMDQKGGCCETKSKLVKADNDHIYAKSLSAPTIVTDLASPEFTEFSSTVLTRDHHYCRYHSPPDPRSNNLAPHISVFRI